MENGGVNREDISDRKSRQERKREKLLARSGDCSKGREWYGMLLDDGNSGGRLVFSWSGLGGIVTEYYAIGIERETMVRGTISVYLIVN